jgi:ABC-type dipeptide/oligopeptide/nickel transport system permease component
MGRWIVNAIIARNFPVVQAGVLVFALVFIIANLLVDLSYGFLDPRVRYG